MSELSGEQGHDRRFGTGNNGYCFPLDPFNDRLIQFNALHILGYPVDVQTFPASELGDIYFETTEQEWERDHFPVWGRPTVRLPEFEHFIEDPDIPGDCIWVDNEDEQDLLDRHPSQLVSKVDLTYVSDLARMIDDMDEGVDIGISDSGSGLFSRDKLVGCFMAALERLQTMRENGYPNDMERRWPLVTEADYMRYEIYRTIGYEPVSPDKLLELMVDYYLLAERLNPEFANFKRVII